ncbi:unnamed protein product (macronuclear) [Paramecium tetraurelia]|uniref:Uncharacterized protein n=1 Tax=Paramecium tetraurelia TaxID=5888 RepID=A0BUM3_PARTE|nr:uncharacterized protein GSPATT00005486001 [Paramecium tetraurelia]CAK62240.1 unnamed protein product [Paramecium tetraurelia]|eukprot:XP_001429638.1 hypothetical protein (macronuclear) [Paramecium tetraurelia strain d4-2]
MSCDCVHLRSELENIRNKQSILLKDHQMQLELVRTKTKEQYESLLETQKQGFLGVQKINEQEINKLKEIIGIKNAEIETLIQTNSKYRAQLNQEEQISTLKIQNLKKESQDILSLINKYQEEINQLKSEQPQREDLLNEQHQLRIEEIQSYYSKLLKQHGKEKQEVLIKIDELVQKEKKLNEQINNQLSQIQLLKIEILDKTSILDQNEKDIQKLKAELFNLQNSQEQNLNENQLQKKSLKNNYDIIVQEYENELEIQKSQIAQLRTSLEQVTHHIQVQLTMKCNELKEETYKQNLIIQSQNNTIREQEVLLDKLEVHSQTNNMQFSQMMENQKKRLEQAYSYQLDNLKKSFQTQIILLQQQQADESLMGRQKMIRRSIADL